MTAKNITIDDVVKTFTRIREQRTALKRKYDEEDAILKEKLERLKKVLLNTCSKLNTNSMNTDHGTVIRSISTRYWTSDWESFDKFILDNKLPSLLERRIAQRNMAEFVKQHPDELPPGVNVQNEYDVTVRRKNAKPDDA